MTGTRGLRGALRLAAAMPACGAARVLGRTGRAPRFSGAYDSRAGALARIGAGFARGYDDPEVAQVSFDAMCRRVVWDYPVLLWLERLLEAGEGGVLDAGGHLGTKHAAWSDLLDLNGVQWTVLDLPGIIAAARALQAACRLPATIRFEDDAARVPGAPILLCSGLLQYLDVPFARFVETLPRQPRHILLNKVALRDGAEVHTVERIGPARVPYRIRRRADWEAEIDAMGYAVLDRWTIPDLGHIIPTHPWLGRSESCGYALRRRGD